MRTVGNRLNEFLPVNISDLINKKCEDQSKRESEEEISDIKDQSIGKCLPECMILHKLLKVSKTAPLFTEDITSGSVLSESNDITEHRNISENNIIDDGNNYHQIKLPVFGQISADLFTSGPGRRAV